jgi:hypothetical protein
MPHTLGSGEYISQGTWKNSLVFLDCGISNPYISLKKDGVLCPFIKSVRDLMQSLDPL